MSEDLQEKSQLGASVVKVPQRAGTSAGTSSRLPEGSRSKLPARAKTTIQTKPRDGPMSEWAPLKQSGEVRLIKLVKTSGLMYFRLKVVRLDENPVFKAVSYEWGPNDKQGGYKVIVDGASKFIRKNLAEFLLKLRDHDPNVFSYWMWIDQICIDQMDLHEKSRQVTQMDRVFRQAEEVIVWLGNSDSHDEETIKSMQEGGASGLFTRSRGVSIFEKPYWRRIWIIQEILLARKLVFLCGAHRIEFDTLMQFIERSKWIVPGSVPSVLNKRKEKVSTIDLRLGLTKFLRYECQYPEDKVYGINALLEPTQRLEVDYTKSRMEVFTDVVNALLKTHFETTSGAPFVTYKKAYSLWDGYSPEALTYDGPVDAIIMAAWFIGGFELRYTASKMNDAVKQKEKAREYFTVEEVTALNDKPNTSWGRMRALLK
jgi:hypothetical protein